MENRQEQSYYYRFSPGKRLLHGMLFSSFLGLALTGLTLRFGSAGWASAFAHGVGGLGAILFFHKAFGVLLTAAFLVHVGNILRLVFVQKRFGMLWGPESLVPQPRDIMQLGAHFRWFLGLGPKPKFDRYAYWEKFDYWAVFWGMAIIGFSGYSMWFAQPVARLLPGSWFNVALLLHGDEALLAVWFIFTIHFFNTHLRPGSFPMDTVIFTGRQTRKELEEKHPAEYERLLAQGSLEGLRAEQPQRWFVVAGKVVGFAAIATGFVLLLLTLFSFRQ
ncbi:MAG TPA: cytochrome b/b6 domain-containing protein [Terriglobia bacterium]|nr:cytochrome b/b6 domain-containing protein [Terriglobia bacterium]